MLNTPILFLVFNRLDTTKQVFAKIREIQPKQLFIGSDGARAGKEGEAEKVQAVRKYILDNIDWECEVKTLFREQNLGCGVAPAEAITWFFENVEQGIILEDDCLPDLSFFTFCEELLNYYKDEEQIMHIGGNNYFNKPQKYSYYFSKYIHPPHGWASWRRAWKVYNYDMIGLPIFLEQQEIHTIIKNKRVANYWLDYFKHHQNSKLDAWDTQWQLDLWLNGGVAIMPYLNLIVNLGFGVEATHTSNPEHRSNVKKIFTIHNIVHPKNTLISDSYDDKKIKYVYMYQLTWRQKIAKFIPSIIKKAVKKFLKNEQI